MLAWDSAIPWVCSIHPQNALTVLFPNMEVKCPHNGLSTNQIAETEAMSCRVILVMAGIFRSVGGQSRSLVAHKFGQNEVLCNNYVTIWNHFIIDQRSTEAKTAIFLIDFWMNFAMNNYFILLKFVTHVMWHCVSEMCPKLPCTAPQSDRIYRTALLGVFCVWMRNIAVMRRASFGNDSPQTPEN